MLSLLSHLFPFFPCKAARYVFFLWPAFSFFFVLSFLPGYGWPHSWTTCPVGGNCCKRRKREKKIYPRDHGQGHFEFANVCSNCCVYVYLAIVVLTVVVVKTSIFSFFHDTIHNSLTACLETHVHIKSIGFPTLAEWLFLLRSVNFDQMAGTFRDSNPFYILLTQLCHCTGVTFFTSEWIHFRYTKSPVQVNVFSF